MKVLVTGGAGFIGSNIVDAYIKNGYEVVVVDTLTTGHKENVNPKATFYKVAVESEEFLTIVEKEKPDVINHHAAQIDVQISIKDPMKDANINILGTINVLEACKKIGASIIYPSSAAVYGVPHYLGIDEKHPIAPISAYGISKYTPESYIHVYHQLYQVPFTIFRYANVYGIRQVPKGEGGVISILIDSALQQKSFTIFGDGKQTRDFIYIDDVVSANVQATKKPINCVVNIGTAIATTLNDTIEQFENIIGFKLSKEHGEERKGDIKDSYLLNDQAKSLLQWNVRVPLSEGLHKTFDYYQKRETK